jgi:hypothetical protein
VSTGEVHTAYIGTINVLLISKHKKIRGLKLIVLISLNVVNQFIGDRKLQIASKEAK